MGTLFLAARILYVTAETPPPVQAAGDTIPKGLRCTATEAFFLSGGNIRRRRSYPRAGKCRERIGF